MLSPYLRMNGRLPVLGVSSRWWVTCPGLVKGIPAWDICPALLWSRLVRYCLLKREPDLLVVLEKCNGLNCISPNPYVNHQSDCVWRRGLEDGN